MARFQAEMFVAVTRWLERIRNILETEAGSGRTALNEDGVRLVRDNLEMVRDACTKLELAAGLQNVKYILGELNEKSKCELVVEQIKMLQAAIESDLVRRVFVFVPPEDAKWFERAHGFGTDVSVAFPSAIVDISEAGNCYAAGRYTASVFHAMCALEPALQVLAKVLKVEHGERPWANVLNEINRALRETQQQGKSAARRKRLTFLAGAAEQFDWFKEAHRNHTMHARAKYDRGTAASVLEHAQRFMHHLAKNGLREKQTATLSQLLTPPGAAG